jgi:protein-disulfide isomerase
MRLSVVLALASAISFGSHTSQAQFLGIGPDAQFKDTSMLKPPAGQKVALVVFEDLGCPACAGAHPLELQAIAQTHVAFLRHDFPIAAHVWTFDGAVCARYIEEKIGPKLATEYRTDIFAAQQSIASKDDLQRFTQLWFQRHGQRMPFVMDPKGSLAKEVQADYDLGRRLNVRYTPTVVVVTKDKYQVVCGTHDSNHPEQIESTIEAALAQTKAERPLTRR